MNLLKGALSASVLAVAAGMTLSLAGSASGPIILGPSVAPIATPKVVATARGTLLGNRALSAYRQIRTFWLSRGIVR